MYVNYIENDYLEKILQYIAQLADKIRLYPELVEKYNENLFFESLNKIERLDLNQKEKEFGDEEELYIYLEFLFEQIFLCSWCKYKIFLFQKLSI